MQAGSIAAHNLRMSAPQIPVNRSLVGAIALACGAIGGGFWLLSGSDELPMMAAAFLRVGIVMFAVWLALPTRTREAAWARVDLWQLLGCVLLIIVTARAPLRFLIPGLVLLIVAVLVLRPRPKRRPRS